MHGRRVLIFISTGVVCVFALLIGAYAVLTAFRPEVEIRRMLVAMSEVSTASQRSAFSWTRGDGEDRVTTTLYSTGQLDVSEPSAVQQATKFRLFRISRSADYADLSGEIRTIGETTYLTYAAPGPDVDAVDFSKDGTWVSFASGELPLWGSLIPGLDDPIREEGLGIRGEGGNWTSDGVVRLRSLLSRADVFVVAYDDLTELISGHATRVIDARFDPDALRSFLRDVVRARENREPTSEERVEVEAEAKALERLEVRLWIGIDDHLLYRAQAAGAVPDAGEPSNVLVPFDTIVELSDFNEPFGGAKPSRSTAFSTISSQSFSHSDDASDGDRAVLLPNDAARLPSGEFFSSGDADQDGLSDVLEAFYQTNPNDSDTDKDGAPDGDEVLDGKNPRGNGTLFGFGLGE